MLKHLKNLWAYRDLLWMWTLRQIKVRYKQSLLGRAWAILQPLSLTLIFTLVFSIFTRISSDGVPYPVFSYTALLPWTFLATSISFGVPSLVNNLNLLTKIYFPREILPLASVAAAFVDFLFASVVFVGMIVAYQVPVRWTFLWLAPLILMQTILTVGIALIASAVNVFYRDVRFVVPLAVQLWMYASPVIYPVSRVPDRLRPFYMLNPMAGLIDSYRRAVLSGEPPRIGHIAPAVLIAFALFLIGYLYFKRVEWQFADVI